MTGPDDHKTPPPQTVASSEPTADSAFNDAEIQQALHNAETSLDRAAEAALEAPLDDPDDTFASIEAFLAELDGLEDPSQLPDAAALRAGSANPAPTAAEETSSAPSAGEPESTAVTADGADAEVDRNDIFARTLAELTASEATDDAATDAEAIASDPEAVAAGDHEPESAAEPASTALAADMLDDADSFESIAEALGETDSIASAQPLSASMPEGMLAESAPAFSVVPLEPPSSEPPPPPADLTLDDELASELDDLFRQPAEDLDDVLNDVFNTSAEDDAPSRAEAAAPRQDAAAVNPASIEAVMDNADSFTAPESSEAEAAPAEAAFRESPAPVAASVEAGNTPATNGPDGSAEDASTPAAVGSSIERPAPRMPLPSATPIFIDAYGNRADDPSDGAESTTITLVKRTLELVNQPLRFVPDEQRFLVNWFAASLALWAPIVWIAAWLFARG